MNFWNTVGAVLIAQLIWTIIVGVLQLLHSLIFDVGRGSS